MLEIMHKNIEESNGEITHYQLFEDDDGYHVVVSVDSEWDGTFEISEESFDTYVEAVEEFNNLGWRAS